MTTATGMFFQGPDELKMIVRLLSGQTPEICPKTRSWAKKESSPVAGLDSCLDKGTGSDGSGQSRRTLREILSLLRLPFRHSGKLIIGENGGIKILALSLFSTLRKGKLSFSPNALPAMFTFPV